MWQDLNKSPSSPGLHLFTRAKRAKRCKDGLFKTAKKQKISRWMLGLNQEDSITFLLVFKVGFVKKKGIYEFIQRSNVKYQTSLPEAICVCIHTCLHLSQQHSYRGLSFRVLFIFFFLFLSGLRRQRQQQWNQGGVGGNGPQQFQ